MTDKVAHYVLLLGVALAASGHAEGLGRLFFTPQQRVYMDRGGVLQQGDVPAPTVDLQAPPPMIHGTVSIDGYIKRSSGIDSAWLNGNQLEPGNDSNGFSVGRADDWPTVTVQLPNGKQVKSKVGETLDENGNVH